MTSTLIRHPAMVEGLLQPEAYPHPVRRVSLLQTHASWLFFTGDFVYKVKKPVDYGFLNFTTPAKRRRFCRLETSLNRRLSPEVYLGVEAVRRVGDAYKVGGGGGEVVDYAVRMRQLRAEDALARRLASGRIDASHLRQIAEKVAAFHQAAKTGPSIVQKGGPQAVRRRVMENISDLGVRVGFDFPAHDLLELRAYSEAFLRSRADLFRARAKRGRVIEGHGDLHAANVFLEDGQVQIIDCIEFNDRFRCMDAAEDIAFLAMDLDFHGRPDLARVFVGEYQRLTGDDTVGELLPFFKVYRALVRAKVNRLLAADPEMDGPEKTRMKSLALDYFRLAVAGVVENRPLPALIALGGATGTGKTTLAKLLAERWGAAHISSDLIRKRLAGIPETERHWEKFGEGIYSPEFSRKTYLEMLSQARRRLEAGGSAILDASFLRETDRRDAFRLARELGVGFCFVHCRAAQSRLMERLGDRRHRKTVSDGRVEILCEQLRRWERHRAIPTADRLSLDTAGGLEETFENLLKGLFEQALAHHPRLR